MVEIELHHTIIFELFAFTKFEASKTEILKTFNHKLESNFLEGIGEQKLFFHFTWADKRKYYLYQAIK